MIAALTGCGGQTVIDCPARCMAGEFSVIEAAPLLEQTPRAPPIVGLGVVAAETVWEQALGVPNGATLLAVELGLDPEDRTTIDGIELPNIEIERVDLFTWPPPKISLARLVDASASAEAYSAPHILRTELAEVIDRSTSIYIARLTAERGDTAGPAAIQGFRITYVQ